MVIMDLRRPARYFQLTVVVCLSLRQKILKTDACSLDSLQDPSRWSSLPFPSLSRRLPLDRFCFDKDVAFLFMGRQIFGEVYQTVSNMSGRAGTIYSLQGSLGTGKSHILAALVCLLIKEGKRVVYLPDARVLAIAIEDYTKEALQLAYADDQALFKQIQGLSSIADIFQFSEERSRLGDRWYIICDQMNALDHFPDTANTLGPNAQQGALQFIQRLSKDHYFIWRASGNCRQAASNNRRQNFGAKRLLFREGYNRVRSSRPSDTWSNPTNMRG